jgi:hypothetical protein
MLQSLETKMKGLIDAYLKSKQTGELGEELDFNIRMKNNRTWLKENVLNLEKLKSYDDVEFATTFGEMFDHTDGDPRSNGFVRGMHFSTNEKRLAVRNQFENLIGYITNHSNDYLEMLEETLNPTSPYKVLGLGKHMISALINAEYPDIPSINNVTEDFFKNIGEPLPVELPAKHREVREFFKEMQTLNSELTLDDIDHIFWYSKNIDSGRNFMMSNFPSTFNDKDNARKSTMHRRRAKKMTPEEQLAARIAELQAIQARAE